MYVLGFMSCDGRLPVTQLKSNNNVNVIVLRHLLKKRWKKQAGWELCE